MKTKAILYLLLPLLTFTGCNGQTKKGEPLAVKPNNGIVSEDTLNKPKVNVKVNKQYDDKGNIVRYDSTYSYFYSSPGGKALNSSSDSVYSHFRSYFDKNYPDFLKPQYDNIFYNDSLFKYDFFNNDYFMKRFELNRKMFDNMYRQMDSLKNDYMYRNYPNGKTKKKTI
jgi:hypothetical protein